MQRLFRATCNLLYQALRRGRTGSTLGGRPGGGVKLDSKSDSTRRIMIGRSPSLGLGVRVTVTGVTGGPTRRPPRSLAVTVPQDSESAEASVRGFATHKPNYHKEQFPQPRLHRESLRELDSRLKLEKLTDDVLSESDTVKLDPRGHRDCRPHRVGLGYEMGLRQAKAPSVVGV